MAIPDTYTYIYTYILTYMHTYTHIYVYAVNLIWPAQFCLGDKLS